MKRRSTRKYFDAARRAADFAIAEYFDAEGGGFFDRASGAAPMGGLELRRKPLQDSPDARREFSAAILLDRLHGTRGRALPHLRRSDARSVCRAIAPQFGIHAASYGLAALLHARGPFEVVITGASDDPQAAALEQAANSVYRFSKAVLRVTPERIARPRPLRPHWPKRCRIFARTSRKRWSAWALRAARRSPIPPRS
jgi:uncharacterized protein YyaL (SSP411 family)